MGERDDNARRPMDMAMAAPLRGLSTVSLFAADHTATAVDPFGNLLGIMYNPHYLEILSSLKPA